MRRKMSLRRGYCRARVTCSVSGRRHVLAVPPSTNMMNSMIRLHHFRLFLLFDLLKDPALKSVRRLKDVSSPHHYSHSLNVSHAQTRHQSLSSQPRHVPFHLNCLTNLQIIRPANPTLSQYLHLPPPPPLYQHPRLFLYPPHQQQKPGQPLCSPLASIELNNLQQTALLPRNLHPSLDRPLLACLQPHLYSRPHLIRYPFWFITTP